MDKQCPICTQVMTKQGGPPWNCPTCGWEEIYWLGEPPADALSYLTARRKSFSDFYRNLNDLRKNLSQLKKDLNLQESALEKSVLQKKELDRLLEKQIKELERLQKQQASYGQSRLTIENLRREIATLKSALPPPTHSGNHETVLTCRFVETNKVEICANRLLGEVPLLVVGFSKLADFTLIRDSEMVIPIPELLARDFRTITGCWCAKVAIDVPLSGEWRFRFATYSIHTPRGIRVETVSHNYYNF